VLDWADNAESDVAGYRVYRGGAAVASPAASAFTDTGLADATMYGYEVTAVDAAGNESQRSSLVSATTDPPDLVQPSPPTGLVPTASLGRVSLDWTDNAESDLAGYRVYRNGALLAPATASAYADTTVADGMTYTYAVTAVDRAGNESGPSATVSATTPRAPIAKSYQPTGYAIVSGAVNKNHGDLPRLYANDGSRVEIAAAFNGTQYLAATTISTTIASSERATLSRLQVDVDGRVTASAAALTISVFDFSSGAWATIDGPRTGVTGDRQVTWIAPGSATDYVSASGEIRVRVRATRSSGFRSDTDLVRYSIEY
jgi:chitodextrinase